MSDYNISEAFAVIEDYLIDSMRRNMLRHIGQEREEHISWSQWQADMLSGLREYRRENADKFKGIYPAIEQKIEDAMREAYDTGEALQEQVILSAIRKGYTAYRPKNTQNGEFFRMNKRKMNALVSETQKSMTRATAAALRMANDQYRSIIFGAQVFYNAGAGTLWQAVDMASKKFLQAGLNCIEYRDGRRVNIASYAEMALRTANTRAYLHGEAAMRERYGIHTVIVNRHNAACPLCVPFQGRVFIDDVWGGGTAAEAQVKGYPLLSEAMAAGLYHPNCKDGHTTFFAGINEFHPPTTRTKEEQVRRYQLQQNQRYHERQIRKYKRLCQGTVDEETRIGYTKKLHEWQQRTQELIDANPTILRRSPPREQLRNIPEELGITPPRNPPGVEIFAQVKPADPPKNEKIRSVIDVKAYSTPPKPPPAIGPSEAERKRDIERIKGKVQLVRQKARQMEREGEIARQKAIFATENAEAAGFAQRKADEEIHAIQTKAKLRDQQLSKQVREAKLSAAEAKKLRRIAEIDKTEARAAQRRYATLMKLDNGGRMKVSVEARTARPTTVKVKPTQHSIPAVTVSVTSKPSVTVSIADERQRDMEAIKAKLTLVKQKAAEMEKEAQAARQAAEAAEAKAQAAAKKAESAKREIRSLKVRGKIRERLVFYENLDAREMIGEARRLHTVAEVAKLEERAALRRSQTLMRLENGGKLTVGVSTRSSYPVSVNVRPTHSAASVISSDIQTSARTRRQRLENIITQPWLSEIREPQQIDEIALMLHKMDDRRLRFLEKYGNLIKGDFYSDKSPQTVGKKFLLNLSRPDRRSVALGYKYTNVYSLLHESGHVLDASLNFRHGIRDLRGTLEEDFYSFASKELGHHIRDMRLTAAEREKLSAPLKNDLLSGVSDMMDAVTNGLVKGYYGHSSMKGWVWTDEKLLSEAVANLFEAFMNGGESYEELKRRFPRSMQLFEDYFDKLI